VIGLLVDGLGMRNTMSTPMERFPGAVLALPGEVEASAHFVYDARGPRTSPAIEVQQWGDPAVEGEPVTDPTAIGMHAIGIAVPDLDAAVAALAARGCTTVTRSGASPVPGTGQPPESGPWATVADPKGVRIDLVADPAIPVGESRFHHVRINVTDLDGSIPWYEGLGFELLERGPLTAATHLGVEGPVHAEVARLRLPDEPFEALLVQWDEPAGHGRHPANANHAGLFRMALGVDDTRAAHDGLVAAGWAFDRAPIEVALNGTPVPDMWIAFLQDPDGVPFELVQRPRSAFR
jgi:catechol 2,3-dioxygenase-like lactoylglutathione lyase family enzyme